MEIVIPDSMKSALETNRQELNTVYEKYRYMHREPDADDILNLFGRMLFPLFEKGLSIPDELLRELFDVVLKLADMGCIGKEGRYVAVENNFFSLIDCYADMLSSEKEFAVTVFNALFNLYSKSEDAMTAWSDKMISLGCHRDVEKFMKLGFVAAWRCGVSRFRDEAVRMIDGLSVEEIKIIFDAENISASDIKRRADMMKTDPWRDLNSAAEEKSPRFLRAGGFTGYGGQFMETPHVFASEDFLFAADSTNVYRIYADCFGVELVNEPGTKPGGVPADPGRVYGKSREVIIGGKAFKLPSFCGEDIRNSASAGNTVVWTQRSSYKIYIAGLAGGAV